MDEITLTGTVTHRGTREPLPGVTVQLVPNTPSSRMSDGSLGLRAESTITDDAGQIAVTIGHTAGLRWSIRVSGRVVAVLDCDSHAPGSTVDLDDLPPEPIPTGNEDALRAWVEAQVESARVTISDDYVLTIGE